MNFLFYFFFFTFVLLALKLEPDFNKVKQFSGREITNEFQLNCFSDSQKLQRTMIQSVNLERAKNVDDVLGWPTTVFKFYTSINYLQSVKETNK